MYNSSLMAKGAINCLQGGRINPSLRQVFIKQCTQPHELPLSSNTSALFIACGAMKRKSFSQRFWLNCDRSHRKTWLHEALHPSFSRTLLHRLRRANLMLKGAQNIHPRATNLGLAHGLQVRSPFCDPSPGCNGRFSSQAHSIYKLPAKNIS